MHEMTEMRIEIAQHEHIPGKAFIPILFQCIEQLMQTDDRVISISLLGCIMILQDLLERLGHIIARIVMHGDPDRLQLIKQLAEIRTR